MIVFGEDAAKIPVLFILSIAIEKIPLPKLNLGGSLLLFFRYHLHNGGLGERKQLPVRDAAVELRLEALHGVLQGLRLNEVGVGLFAFCSSFLIEGGQGYFG